MFEFTQVALLLLCLYFFQIPAGYWESIKDSLPSTSRTEEFNSVAADGRYVQSSGIEEEEDEEDEVTSAINNTGASTSVDSTALGESLNNSAEPVEPQVKRRKLMESETANNEPSFGTL